MNQCDGGAWRFVFVLAERQTEEDGLSAALVSFVLVSSLVVKTLCGSLVLSLISFIRAFLHLCLHRLVLRFTSSLRPLLHRFFTTLSLPSILDFSFLPSVLIRFYFLSSFNFSRLFFTRRLNISS